MKKKVIGLVTLCLVVIVTISSFFIIREANLDYGREQGYLIGYSIGHTDKATGEKQNSQKLASSIVPYEIGSAKWKGFMLSFTKGYSDGFNGKEAK